MSKDRVLYSVYRVNDLAVEVKLRKKPRKIQPTFCEERAETNRRRRRKEEGEGNEVTEFGLFGVGYV